MPREYRPAHSTLLPRSLRPTSLSGRLSILVIALCLAGCSTAPLIQDAGRSGPSVFDQLESALEIETTTADGTTLRGVHVARPDTPWVVLHLLPSGASVTTGLPAGIGRIALTSTLKTLHAEGFSSVVLDYRGVGGSDGRRRTDQLLEDGRTMWAEALKLSGGHADRIIIRAGSLGTLIAADLLEQGAEPAGVILFAPIRAGTIVENAARERRGSVGAWLAQAFQRVPDAPDLVSILKDPTIPLLMVLAVEDAYLPPDEQELVRVAAEAGGHEVVMREGDHQMLILRSWGFSIDTEEFSGRRTPELLAEELKFLNALGSR